ncbi:MAG: L,D-transpeptidase family protein [Oliverpabstia sp.]|nr:L,D-transpeptidase family protein [Oliverpabstia sp.]
MKTRRSLLLGLGILASLSMTIPVAAGNVEQAVVSSVEGQQDQTTPPSQSGEGNTDGNTEDNGEGNTGNEGVETPEVENHYPYFERQDGKFHVWDEKQSGYTAFEGTGVFEIIEMRNFNDDVSRVYYLKDGMPQGGIIAIGETEEYKGEGISSVDSNKLQPGKTYYFNEQGPAPDFLDREPLGVLQENLTDKDIWMQRKDGGWVCITPGSAVDTTRIGWQEINGSWKYLKEDGTVDFSQNGWVEIESGRWIYAEQGNGTVKTGWQEINGSWKYLKEDGTVETGKTGWQEINGSWKYLKEDGTVEAGKTGWQEINGSWKYLKENGIVDTGKNGWMEMESGRWIYVSKGNGNFKTGWQQVNGKWYYLDKTGKRDTSKTGLQENVQGNTYLLNKDGTVKTGFQNVSGHTYYFGKDGKRQNYTGWKTIDGKIYYFNNAYQVINTGKNGWYHLNNQWYWMENGQSVTGWRNINGNWYYMDPANGVMRTGFFKDSTGSLYHSNGSGAMTGGGWNLINGNWYWMHNNGVVQQGWLKLGNTWYYLDANTGVMKTGWYQVNGSWYYSNGSGAMQTGWINLGGTWYYLHGNGAMAEGWINLGGTWYYLIPGHGGMKTGWYQVNGSWYYSNGSGAMQTGWIKPGGTWYYLHGSGAMAEGWINLGGTWYYLTPGNGGMRTGWYQVDGTWYYSRSNGAMAANAWIDGYYYVGANGAMVSNCWVGPYWVGADGRWRPNYDPDLTGANWVQKGSKWYFQREDGTYLKNQWKKINGSWYWFEGDGTMVTGWKYIDGLKYYFDGSGKMLQDVDGLIGKQSSYRITLNRRKCQIMVYAKSETGKYDIPVKTFVCSVGLPATPTPVGTFHTLQKAGSAATQGIVELMGPSWGKWGTMFTWTDKYHIWFHSVACSSTDPTYSLPAGAYNQLGMPASHGCVRLNVRDAKWIYMNCPLGTEVTVSDNESTPFDKPASIRIPAGQRWDPTDPAL